MKKLFVLAMAVVAMSFAACGNKTEEAATEDSLVVDSPAVEQTEEEATLNALTEALKEGDTQKIQDVLSSVDAEQAKEYALQLQKFYEEHKAELSEKAVSATTISDLVSTVTALPETATDAAQEAKAAAKADAQKLVDDAKTKATEKANEAVNTATQKATDAASDAVNTAASKASNAISNKLKK